MQKFGKWRLSLTKMPETNAERVRIHCLVQRSFWCLTDRLTFLFGLISRCKSKTGHIELVLYHESCSFLCRTLTDVPFGAEGTLISSNRWISYPLLNAQIARSFLDFWKLLNPAEVKADIRCHMHDRFFGLSDILSRSCGDSETRSMSIKA